MLIDILLIIVGLVLLIRGGDWLVDGASAIARRAKLDSMVIGLTVVAFGTSAPEFLVSLQASLRGSTGIALGNVVGSNIANIALILGVTAILAVAPVRRITLKVDMPFLLVVTLLMSLAAMNGSIGRVEGIVAVGMLVAYTAWQIRHARRHAAATAEPPAPTMRLRRAAVLTVVACVALALGADWLVDGASGIARTVGHAAGIDPATVERIIGLTIVAVGTSLPELSASVMAARRGETDMAIGNVIGSNIFNILCVIGVSAAIHPIADSDNGFLGDYLWMIGLAALLWIFLRTGRRLSHVEGWTLVTLYAAFLVMTIL